MNMWRALAVLVPLWVASAHAVTCGPHTPPAPAAAHGFTCETFWDDFSSMATIDLAMTKKQGFKWYPDAANGPATYAIVSGGLQITPTTNTDNDGVNLPSCPIHGGEASGWNAVVGGMYVDIKMSSKGALPATKPRWWPAIWLQGFWSSSQFSPPEPWNNPELDLLEFFWDGGGTPARFVNYWVTTGGGNFSNIGSQTYVTSPTYADGNTYGGLILAPEQNGGTGTVIGYLNDVVEPTGTPKTWLPGGLYRGFSEIPLASCSPPGGPGRWWCARCRSGRRHPGFRGRLVNRRDNRGSMITFGIDSLLVLYLVLLAGLVTAGVVLGIP
jgi:hypothetical protein